MSIKRILFIFIILMLLATSIQAQQTPALGPQLIVNATSNVKPISPYIYGLNFANESLAANIALPVNRWGGNMTTRYNWKTDIANHGMDWYFENIKETDSTNLPDDSAFTRFVDQNVRTGTETLMVIPMIGWTTKMDSLNKICGFSVAKYGAQQSTDWEWQPDCGNGIRPNGNRITNNDPLDTSMVITEQWTEEWMTYLIGRYGTSTTGGVRFYNLDNEPSLWNETHRDVYKTPLSYDGLRDLTYTYARAIKDTDPNAQVLGPVEYGWTAYFYSALDWSTGGAWWNNPIDRNAHGGVPIVEWYLQQMQQYETNNGIRILDYLDLHYYPAAPGVTLTTAGNASTQALRLRSTRSLWDPTYIDESWIGTDVGEAVYLIPRMQAWIDANYPGTKIAITEYNWGGLEHINGALAQADVLGIFGRENVGLATLWSPPNPGQPGAYAFRIYRNYDGAGSQFGDTSVQATSGNQDKLSIYAATRGSDGALTLVIINKTATALSSPVTINNFNTGPAAQVYRYSAADLKKIVKQADQPISEGSFTMTFPANSITVVEIPEGSTVSETELSTNGGFESGLSGTWVGSKLVGDRKVCNQVGKPAVARTGNCAFRFTGSGVTSVITQTIKAPAIQSGDLITISGWIKGSKVTAGGQLQALVYYGGTKKVIKVILPKGTYNYRLFGASQKANAGITSIKFRILTSSVSGSFLVDDAKLAVVPGGLTRSNEGWIPLPAGN